MLLAFSYATTHSQPITTPRTPSPAATLSQTIGISTITVNYSRPSVKGREVWGKLVPYGWNVQGFGNGNSAPWRAGANENTVLTLSHDAKIQGQPVPAGQYGLFFVINHDNTGELILSKDTRSWGSFFYDSKNDQLKSKIQVREIPHTDLLTFDVINTNKNSGELVLNWEKKQFPVKIEFDVDRIVLANAAEELKGPTGFNWQGFSSAANYSLQNKTNYDQALKWIDQAIAQHNAFATLNIKSGLLKEMGKPEEAEKIMNDALAIATEAELNAYGYQLMGNGQVDKAIEVFTLNTKKFPRSANAFDSLGEGYVTKGDKKNAILNFKKSLSMNPPANTKANSEKFLKDLGAL
jgi:predicted negative regulator of RcsB-dependent stress response